MRCARSSDSLQLVPIAPHVEVFCPEVRESALTVHTLRVYILRTELGLRAKGVGF